MSQRLSTRLHRSLPLSTLLLASGFAACSATSTPPPGASGGSAGSDGSAASAAVAAGGTPAGGSGGASAGGSGLPRPWQYDGAYKDPALPDDVNTKFDGPAAAEGAPLLRYPLEGSMHAMNLGDITLQWDQGAATSTLFRVAVRGADGTSYLYVPCAAPPQCSYQMPESEWLDLGKHHANQELELEIAGTDGNGGPVATSVPIAISFSPEPVLGGLYYWAAKTNSIKRATFGAKQAVPYIVPNSDTNDFGCASCHSVSRDGKVIAFAVSQESGETVAAIQTAPTDRPDEPFVKPHKGVTPFPPDMAGVGRGGTTDGQPTEYFGHMPALSPDGSLMVVNGIQAPTGPMPPTGFHWPPYLELRNVQTGASIQRFNLGDPIFGEGALGILPEWSPDGKSIAVALAHTDESFACIWSYDTCYADIAVIPYENGTLGQARVVVQGGTESPNRQYHFYPSWSPDGKYLVFASAMSGMNASQPSISLSNWNAFLRMAPATGGPFTCPGDECYELTRGTQYEWEDAVAGQGKHSTWPKFTPFAQGADDHIMFVSMTSSIDYGFLAQGKSQLWMFAIDTSKLAPGADPSYAPVWLPYQSVDDGGLSPYWTETLPCNADPSGACAGCVAGEQCVVDQQNQCECRAEVK